MTGTSPAVTLTGERAQEYASIECVGQYLFAAWLINSELVPHRGSIARLVDFGCGAGKSTRAVAPCVRPGGTLMGVDVSEELLKQAVGITNRAIAMAGLTPASEASHLLHVGGFSFRRIEVSGDDERILLASGFADAVTSTIMLQEIQTEALLSSALKEMARIAKRGARLAIAAVSDRIVCEDYTAFTYAPFPENAHRPDNIRKCRSTLSPIVWESDRHWSKELLVDGLAQAGWKNLRAEYPLPPPELRPFPESPQLAWKDESVSAPLLFITGQKL